MSIGRETAFRRIMDKLVDNGACGFCALEASIGYVDGSGIPKSVRECRRKAFNDRDPVKCVNVVKTSLDKESNEPTPQKSLSY